jgi:DNA-binding transcriptional LysR family regulator
MDIQDIEIFSRVAHVQNLSAVGAELGLTPGTISKRLQALEDELAVRLFDRTTRSIRITEEGSRFLVHVHHILEELERARATVSDTAGRPKGKLRIAASLALAHTSIGPAIVQFLSAYPEVDVHVDLTDQTVNLQERGYDLAVHVGTLADSTLIAKRLASDRQIIVAAPAYLRRAPPIEKPDDIGEHQSLAHGDTWTWSLTNGTDDVGVRLNVRLRSDTIDMLRLAAIDGQGLMRASQFHVQPDLDAGRLVRVLEPYEAGANAGIWALYASGKHVLPRTRVCLDFLAEWFRGGHVVRPRDVVRHG